MIKANAIGMNDEPVLIISFTREDMDALFAGNVISQTIRSKSGIEATVMVSGAPDEEVVRVLHGNHRAHRIAYRGPLMESASENVGG
jgi:hypothetical protein